MESSGKGDGGKDPNPVFSIPPKIGLKLQSFFNFNGIAVKPICECGTYIHDMPYWIGDQGPICYRCYLRGDKK